MHMDPRYAAVIDEKLREGLQQVDQLLADHPEQRTPEIEAFVAEMRRRLEAHDYNGLAFPNEMFEEIRHAAEAEPAS